MSDAPLREIFTRDFLMLATINLSMFFGFQMLNIGLPVYMAQLGAAGQIIGLATTLMTIMATIMRVFAGALLDRFGRWGMLIGGIRDALRVSRARAAHERIRPADDVVGAVQPRHETASCPGY